MARREKITEHGIKVNRISVKLSIQSVTICSDNCRCRLLHRRRRHHHHSHQPETSTCLQVLCCTLQRWPDKTFKVRLITNQQSITKIL